MSAFASAAFSVSAFSPTAFDEDGGVVVAPPRVVTFAGGGFADHPKRKKPQFRLPDHADPSQPLRTALELVRDEHYPAKKQPKRKPVPVVAALPAVASAPRAVPLRLMKPDTTPLAPRLTAWSLASEDDDMLEAVLAYAAAEEGWL